MADEIRDANNVVPVQEEVNINLNTRRTRNKLDVIDRKMDNLYKAINISRTDNRDNLDSIINDLDTALDRLQGSDISISNMSELIRRLDKKNSTDTEEFLTGVASLFEDDSIIGSLIANETIHQYICAENYTYDMLCKYMPRLQTALEIKRDNVLSSDNFSKEFINPQSYISVKRDSELFAINTKKLERTYDISRFFEKTYMNVSKYGEDFIYIVPYNIAFERVIRRTRDNLSGGRNAFTSFNLYGESTTCISEGFIESRDFKNYVEEFGEKNDFKGIKEFVGPDFSLDIHFNTTNVIQNTVNEMAIVQEKSNIEAFRSLSSIREGSIQEKSMEKTLRKMTPDNDGLTKSANGGVQDGLIVPGELRIDPDKIDNNFLGAVVERLPRENVLPIYIGNVCFGYYYFEIAEDPTACGFCGGHHMTPGLSNASSMAYQTSETQEEMVIRYISAKISNAIDTKFINANKDLKEEIYSILRYNEKFDLSKANHLGVTFIPADDIVHCYFDIDEKTHRGISDLKNSVTTGMLYILLYLTTLIGQVTRSSDKRVYYVKQNVETNVSRTMMNVVKQIKKGNMGMRQIESMNNILNIVGKYNDYIIPTGPSGDAPIQFEVMQGQDIQTPSDMMDRLEEQSINHVVPFEFVNSVMQQDFATRFSMTNTRFLKMINTCQRATQKFFSPMYTKIYNYEYDEHFANIDIILPPPLYLIMTNNSQLIDNISQMADKIIETNLPDADDEVKNEFKRLYTRSTLATYIDYGNIDRIVQSAKVNVEANKDAATNDGESSGDYM